MYATTSISDAMSATSPWKISDLLWKIYWTSFLNDANQIIDICASMIGRVSGGRMSAFTGYESRYNMD